MHILLVSLVSQFVLHKLSGIVLSLNHVHLTLGERLLLLLSYHHVDILRLLFFILTLLHASLLVHLEILFGGKGAIPSLVLRFSFTHVDARGLFLLPHAMSLGLHVLFHAHLLLLGLLLSDNDHVPLALVDDFSSSLSSFINFADSLSFFRLKKANAIDQQSEVLFSLFAGLFG